MSASTDQPPLVLLIHGAWHGAWCWAPLQAQLDERGIASMAIDLPGHGASLLPLGDLHGDAAHVADVVSALDRRVILVGHSYGGAVITEAAVASERVAHLVLKLEWPIALCGANVTELFGIRAPALDRCVDCLRIAAARGLGRPGWGSGTS